MMSRCVLVVVLAAAVQSIIVPADKDSLEPRTDTDNLARDYKGPREYTIGKQSVPSAKDGLDIAKFHENPVQSAADPDQESVLKKKKGPRHNNMAFLRRTHEGKWEVGIPMDIYEASKSGSSEPIKEEDEAPQTEEKEKPEGDVEPPKEIALLESQESEEPLETVPSGFKPVPNLNGDYYHQLFDTEEQARVFIDKVTGASQPFPPGAQPAPKVAKKAEDPIEKAIEDEAKSAVKEAKGEKAAGGDADADADAGGEKVEAPPAV